MEYDDLVATIGQLDAAWKKLVESDERHHQCMADHIVTMRNKLNEDRVKTLGGYFSPEAMKKELDRGPVLDAC